MKIRVQNLRYLVQKQLLFEAQRDADYLKKINMHKIRDSEPDLDPRELQKKSLDGPIFDKDTLDFIIDIPGHELPRENRKQFIKWLASNASSFQFFDPSDIRLVTDWIIGANIKISDLPECLDDAYFNAMDWHESLTTEKLGSAIEETGQENVVYEFSDGFKILELTPEECRSEGDSMGICVGGEGYVQDVRSKKMKIFSLRDPENRPHATISVVPGEVKGIPWKVGEVKGKQNLVPIEKYARRIREWLKTAGFDVSGSDDYFSILSVDEKRDLLTKSRSDPEAFFETAKKIISRDSGLSAQDLVRITLGAAMSVIDEVPDPKRTRELLGVIRDWTRGRASDKDIERARKELWDLYVAAPRAAAADRPRAAAMDRVARAARSPFTAMAAVAAHADWIILDALAVSDRPQEIINSIEKEVGMPLEDFLFKDSIQNDKITVEVKDLRQIIRDEIIAQDKRMFETVVWGGTIRSDDPPNIVNDEPLPVPNDVDVVDDDDILNEVDDAIKPKYKGNFVGHTVTTNDKVVWKNVSWEKGGERFYGKVPSMAKITLVWNGNDWVTMEEFRRGRGLKTGEKESVADFLKRGGKIKKV